MKKLFVCALAVGLFTACSQDETISQQSPMQISFNGAFVENATRADVATDPSTTTTSITAFDVWGFMDTPNGVIFESENVTGTQGNFSYVNTQYWVANHDYYFAALAPMDSKNVTVDVDKSKGADKYGLGTVHFTITDGSEDLLYAATTRELKDEIDDSPVKFVFNHLLSKVKFTFKNGFTNDNMKIKVTNIKMTVPVGPGTINLNQADWWTENHWILERPESQFTALAFGDAGEIIAASKEQESADERLIFPTSVKNTLEGGTSWDGYSITFTVELYNGEVLAGTYNHTTALSGVDFKIGKAYDLIAELNATNIDPSGTELSPIVFDVQEVKKWEQGETPVGLGQNVATEDELVAALAKGGDIYVNSDLAITKELTVAKDKSVNLFLGGKTLSIKNATTGINNAGKLNIYNGAVKYEYTGNYAPASVYIKETAILNDKGVLALNNVTVESDVWGVNTFGTWIDDVTLQNQGEPTVKTNIVGGEIKSTFTHESGVHVYAIGVIDNALVAIDEDAKVTGDGAIYVNCGKVYVNEAALEATCGTGTTTCFYANSAAIINYTENTTFTGSEYYVYKGTEPGKYGDIVINGAKK